MKGHSERGQTSQQRTSQKHSLYRKSPLKEDNLSTKYKTAGPEGVLIKRFHCTFSTSKKVKPLHSNKWAVVNFGSSLSRLIFVRDRV